MKKLYMLIGIIILSFLIFLYIINKSKEYTINYKFNNYEIKESYSKNYYGYFLTVKYDNTEYPIFLQNRYIKKRKLINKIVVNKEKENVCLDIVAINKKNTICSINNILVDVNIMPSDYLEKYYKTYIDLKEKIKSYKQITIYNQDSNYLIWNYKGFYRLSKDNIEEIKVLNKDNYKNILSYQTEEYLLFPNYDEEYFFTKLYVYDMKNNVINDVNFTNEISYESSFIGNYKNKVYLLDKKNKEEYEINLKKNTLTKISKEGFGLYFNGKELEKIQISKMINKSQKFVENLTYQYIIDDQNLYLLLNNYKILISKNIKDIVYIENDKVYFLIGDEMFIYKYNGKKQALLKNKEWNFNYNNQIFIFN